jgi:hypothetical protein
MEAEKIELSLIRTCIVVLKKGAIENLSHLSVRTKCDLYFYSK